MIWRPACERRQPGAVIEKDLFLPPSRNLMIPFTFTRASDSRVLHVTLLLACSGGRPTDPPHAKSTSVPTAFRRPFATRAVPGVER